MLEIRNLLYSIFMKQSVPNFMTYTNKIQFTFSQSLKNHNK